MQPNVVYASYLLRLRQVQNDERAMWVASVQSTASGQVRSFPSVEALARFLEAEYGGCDPWCDGNRDATGPGRL